MNHRLISRLRAPKAVLVVKRERFELHQHLKSEGYRRRVYPIAVGKVGDATPAGVYYVDAKTRKPDWLVPDHPDYEDEGIIGTVIPFEHPRNPFAGGFLSLSDEGGVGIHSVRFPPKLGTRASHGCIRMDEKDFLKLYRDTRLGTPVVII